MTLATNLFAQQHKTSTCAEGLVGQATTTSIKAELATRVSITFMDNETKEPDTALALKNLTYIEDALRKLKKQRQELLDLEIDKEEHYLKIIEALKETRQRMAEHRETIFEAAKQVPSIKVRLPLSPEENAHYASEQAKPSLDAQEVSESEILMLPEEEQDKMREVKHIYIAVLKPGRQGY